jgi:hypothetical protein
MTPDDVGPDYGPEAAREARRQLEGEERVALLPDAEFIAVSVGSEPGDPAVVFIGWSSTVTENAYPGTAIWQAALRSFLRSAQTGDAAESFVRAAAAESLERFTSLDRWLSWYDHERQARQVERAARASGRRPFWIGRLW